MNLRILYTVTLITLFTVYPILNRMPQEAHVIKSWLDDYVPFIPFFSVPYILYIPYITFTLIFFVYFSRHANSITLAVSFCLIVASLFYIFHQTTVPRPEVLKNDIFSNIVKLVYKLDKPYNCFPSLHVTLSSLSYLYWRKLLERRIKFYLFLFIILIILSTLFIKQHYLPDVVSGLILASLGYFFGQLGADMLKQHSSFF